MGEKQGIAIVLINLGNVALARGSYAAARAPYEESLALCKEMDEKIKMTAAMLGLGLVDIAENNANAREHILHSLRLEMGRQLQQTSSLVGMAGLALHSGNPAVAAQLLGAVDAALKALNAVVEPDVIHIHAQTLAAQCGRHWTRRSCNPRGSRGRSGHWRRRSRGHWMALDWQV